MENNTENKKKITPPYASITNIQNIFHLLESRSFSQLSLNDLLNRGFSKTDAFQSLQALRFLGFLDNKGNLVNNQILSLKGEAKTEALRKLVRESYKKLYDINPNPEKLSKDDLHNEFLAVYNISPRLISSALPLFLWLSNEAGIKVDDKNLPRIKQRVKTNKKTMVQKSFIENKNENKVQVFSGNIHEYEIDGIKISIPKNKKTDLLIAEGGLIEITKQIKEFAKKSELISENIINQDPAGEVA